MADCNRFYVYIHRFSNGVLYVGKGTNGRCFQFSLNRHNIHWDRLLIKHGRPKAKILKNKLSEFEALALEVELISRLRSKGKMLCNRTDGGNGCLGMSVSKETRAKLSAASIGRTGYRHTKDAKEKVSEANKGRFVGNKSKRYKKEAFKFVHESGKTFSGTQWQFSKEFGIPQPLSSMLCCGKIKSTNRWRISTTLKNETFSIGRRNGRYDHTVYHFIHKDGTNEICTKNDLCKKYHLPYPSNLATLCKGKIKSYKGWRVIIN